MSSEDPFVLFIWTLFVLVLPIGALPTMASVYGVRSATRRGPLVAAATCGVGLAWGVLLLVRQDPMAVSSADLAYVLRWAAWMLSLVALSLSLLLWLAASAMLGSRRVTALARGAAFVALLAVVSIPINFALS